MGGCGGSYCGKNGARGSIENSSGIKSNYISLEDMTDKYSSAKNGGSIPSKEFIEQLSEFYRKNAPVSGGIGGQYNELERAAYTTVPNKGMAGSSVYDKFVTYN